MPKVFGCKRKLRTRTITGKYKILKEVDKAKSSTSMRHCLGGQKKNFEKKSREKQNFCKKSQDASLPL